MRVVVTGFDARSARPAVGEQRLSMGFLIAEAFRMEGHDVQAELCHPAAGSACADFYDDADLIFVGLASPVGLTSTYANHALLVLSRHWEDPRLRVFIDDPDPNKITYGARSASRNEASTDPLFSNRVFRSRYLADDLTEAQKSHIYRACELLTHRELWPMTFIPVQTRWFGAALAELGLGIDLTQVAVELIGWQPPYDQGERIGWLLEPQRRKQWAQTTPVRGIQIPLGNQPVDQRFASYRTAVGVLQSAPAGANAPGWWTPAATIASRTGTFFATDLSRLDDVEDIQHSAYYVLPATFEDMAPAEREDIVGLQVEELMASSLEVADVVKGLSA